MSKRFGRNQRRKAREAMAGAENEIAQLNDLVRLQRIDRDRQAADARQMRAKVAVHERQMAACRKVLGDSIALPPIDQVVDSKAFKEMVEAGWQVQRAAQPWAKDFFPVANDPMQDLMQHYETLTADAIEGGLEHLGRDALYSVPHAYVTTKQGAIMYRVNLESLAQIDRPEAIARIADMLAREFIDTLQRFRPDRMRRR
jgi:hypothetical protein